MGHKGGPGEKGRTGGFGFPGTVNTFIKTAKTYYMYMYTFSLHFCSSSVASLNNNEGYIEFRSLQYKRG